VYVTNCQCLIKVVSSNCHFYCFLEYGLFIGKCIILGFLINELCMLIDKLRILPYGTNVHADGRVMINLLKKGKFSLN
jgi:hypothetical protein